MSVIDGFTASNGIRFIIWEGRIMWARKGKSKWRDIGEPVYSFSTYGYEIGSMLDDALAELYRAREDERRGRQPAPEPEWYNAKPGEIWVLTIGSYSEQIARVTEGGLVFQVLDDGLHYALRFKHITDGYRIWPIEKGENNPGGNHG